MARKRLTNNVLQSYRSAAPKPPERPPSSAHPADENFDPIHAAAIMGDLAEQVRSQLAKDYDARPPGLQTVDNGDGSLSVICDDPAAGLGLQVKISPIQPGSMVPQPGQPQVPSFNPGFGMGPSMPQPQWQQPPNQQVPMPQPMPQGQGMGMGPAI